MPSDSGLKEAIRQGHEGDDLPEKWVAVTALGLAIVVPVLMFFVWLHYRSLAGARYAGLVTPTIRAPQSEPRKNLPEPRLIVTSGEQMQRFRAAEEMQLTNYGWIGATQQWVRIPIARAMDLIVERGLPVRGSNVNSIGPSEMDLVKQRRLQESTAPIKEIK